MTEDRIAELLAAEPTMNWHFGFMFRLGLDGPDRPQHAAAFVRRHTLHCVGVALIEGYDGGAVAPKPRNAHEHRVGEVYVGSVMLHESDRLDGIDWWRVAELVGPLVVGVDETPPLKRRAA